MAAYDPIIGDIHHSPLKRVPLNLTDREWDHPVFSDLYLYEGESWFIPETMLSSLQFRKFAEPVIMGRVSSVDAWISNTYKDQTKEKRADIRDRVFRSIFELRVRHDFEFWCAKCVRLTLKDGTVNNLTLNRPQRLTLPFFEKPRLAREPIRVDILKHRQWGATTMCYLYMLWMQLYRKMRWDSLIVGHMKDLAQRVLGLYERVRQTLPVWSVPKGINLVKFAGTANTKELTHREATITVVSVENPNAPSGHTPKMVHCTEIGKWPSSTIHSAELTIQNIEAMLVNASDTFGVREGSAQGAIGTYWKGECEKASKGDSGYAFCFIGWAMDPQYQDDVSDSFLAETIDSWKHQSGYISEGYEISLWDQGATIEGIAWYRRKRADFPRHSNMMEEFPTTWREAFQTQQHRVFIPEYVTGMRDFVVEPLAVGELIGNSPIGQEALVNVEFVSNPNGALKIWEWPGEGVDIPQHHMITNRYCAGADPAGGISTKASYNCIHVIDRGPMVYGKPPRTVATWEKRIDQDIAAWKFAQLAKFYQNAYLAVENNYLRQDRSDVERGDEANFAISILNTIFEHYDNIFYEIKEHDARKPLTFRLGFTTTVDSKSMIVGTMNRAMREKEYHERNARVLDQAEDFIIHPGGGMKHKVGGYDDALLSQMLTVWLALDHMDVPMLKDTRKKRASITKGHVATIS